MATVEAPRTEVRAVAKYVRTAPRKAQLVAEQIRGRTVPEARTILTFMTRDAARDVEKVLASAVANAEANHGLDGDELYVSSAYVGAGPTLKRWRARARGRVARIKKRTCHITIALALPGEETLPAPVSPPAVEAAPEEAPKPRRAAPKRRAEPETAAPTATPAETDEVEAAAEPVEAKPSAGEETSSPKRVPRGRPAEPAEEDAAPGPVEEAPKTKRPRRKPTETGEAAPATEEKPKRAPRKKAATPETEASGSGDAPKPAGRRTKPSRPKGES